MYLNIPHAPQNRSIKTVFSFENDFIFSNILMDKRFPTIAFPPKYLIFLYLKRCLKLIRFPQSGNWWYHNKNTLYGDIIFGFSMEVSFVGLTKIFGFLQFLKYFIGKLSIVNVNTNGKPIKNNNHTTGKIIKINNHTNIIIMSVFKLFFL